MTEYLNVGKIVNTHGIRGEVRVISQTDFAEERYQPGKQLVLFRINQPPLTVTIATYRRHKNFDLVSFEGYPTINQVEVFRDGLLKVSKDDLVELAADEFYYHDIIGATVQKEDETIIGKVKEILSPGANDVWVVQRKGKKDALIPFIESVVKSVDVANQLITVDLPEGLIDDED